MMDSGHSGQGLYDSMTLYRSSDEAALGGVFSGLAHKWGLNKTGLRIAFVLVVLFVDMFLTFFMLTIGMILAYILLCLILPKRPTTLSPEHIASNAIKQAYSNGDLHLAIHYAEKFLHNHPTSPKKDDVKKVLEELKGKAKSGR